MTSRYQTTLPREVREVLGVQKHDQIQYSVVSPGKVVITKATEEQEVHTDEALQPFLKLLEQHIKKEPEALKPVTRQWADELSDLVSDISVDLDAHLPEDSDERS